MDVTRLLDRLRKVRPNGAGKWLACCPAHDDKTPSLAIRLADDGRLLIHCFGGCGAADVIAAVGMEFAELFPEPLQGEIYHKSRVSQPFTAADALRCLARESGVIAIAVADIAEKRQLKQEDAIRVDLAAARLATALEYVYDHR